MRVESVKTQSEDKRHDIFINNVKVGYHYIFRPDSTYSIHVDEDKKGEVLKYKISEFDHSIDTLKVPFKYEGKSNFDWVLWTEYVYIRLKDWFDKKAPVIYLEIQADTDNWEKPFSLIKMVNKLEQLCENDGQVTLHLEDPEVINNGFGIQLQIANTDISALQVYHEILDKFDALISTAISSLLLEVKQNSLTSIFRFPEEIKVPCEQYLIYFSRFLEDLGINAKTTVETRTQSTLFTITPEDPTQALSQIRDALNIYLNLPEMPEDEFISREYDDIAVQQLIATIYHLKSQLALANSIIQAKDMTIKNLSFVNFQQRQLLESVEKKKSEEEELFGGLVTIGEYKGNGFKIKVAEIFRLLKRKFRQ